MLAIVHRLVNSDNLANSRVELVTDLSLGAAVGWCGVGKCGRGMYILSAPCWLLPLA